MKREGRPSVPERTLCQRSSRSARIELSHQELRCVRREGGDKARKGFVSARVVLGHDRLARGAKGEAEVVDHGGDQEAAHDAAGHEGGKRDPKRWAEAQPAAGDAHGGLSTRVVWQVAAGRGAHGGSHLPVRGSQQIMIEQIPVDARVVHELGHVSTLPAEHHLRGPEQSVERPRSDKHLPFVSEPFIHHRRPWTRVEGLEMNWPKCVSGVTDSD